MRPSKLAIQFSKMYSIKFLISQAYTQDSHVACYLALADK